MAELLALAAFVAVLVGTVGLAGPWVGCIVLGGGLGWAAWVARQWDDADADSRPGEQP